MFARAGLHLCASTVRSKLVSSPPKTTPVPEEVPARRGVRSKHPNDVWLSDLTTVPTTLGLAISWMPFSLPQRWPFCLWVAVVVDHYSRRFLGSAVYRKQPSSKAVRELLELVVRRVGAVPAHLITDHGWQFAAEGFRNWCQRRGIRQRFGAVRKYGTVCIIERLIRTIKDECTRRLLFPFAEDGLGAELLFFETWYNVHRPHQGCDI